MKAKKVDELCDLRLPRVVELSPLRPPSRGVPLRPNMPTCRERFFRRASDRPGAATDGLFDTCPWGQEKQAAVCCWECHEELMRNPVLLPGDMQAFAELVRKRGLGEDDKPETKDKIAGRVLLLHEVIATGLIRVELPGDSKRRILTERMTVRGAANLRPQSGRSPAGRRPCRAVALQFARGTISRFSSTATRSPFMPSSSISASRLRAAQLRSSPLMTRSIRRK